MKTQNAKQYIAVVCESAFALFFAYTTQIMEEVILTQYTTTETSELVRNFTIPFSKYLVCPTRTIYNGKNHGALIGRLISLKIKINLIKTLCYFLEIVFSFLGEIFFSHTILGRLLKHRFLVWFLKINAVPP
jgi:hypothetical protein